MKIVWSDVIFSKFQIYKYCASNTPRLRYSTDKIQRSVDNVTLIPTSRHIVAEGVLTHRQDMRFTALFELCKYIQVVCFVDWGAAYDKIVRAWIWDIIAFL